jgi:RNA polymerase sigma-70 factor (ECF subfamily)
MEARITRGLAIQDLPEREVIRGAQAGNERMYRELVSRYLRKGLAVAWEFTDTLDDAEDIVQEAFGRVVNTIQRFDAERPFAPWFFTILRNVARSRASQRARRLSAAIDESEPDQAPTPDEVVEFAELQAMVDLELGSLSEMQRACFRLCVLEGFSSKDVATALGVTDRTVRTHVFRARQSLRKAVLPHVVELRDDVASS